MSSPSGVQWNKTCMNSSRKLHSLQTASSRHNIPLPLSSLLHSQPPGAYTNGSYGCHRRMRGADWACSVLRVLLSVHSVTRRPTRAQAWASCSVAAPPQPRRWRSQSSTQGQAHKQCRPVLGTAAAWQEQNTAAGLWLRSCSTAGRKRTSGIWMQLSGSSSRKLGERAAVKTRDTARSPERHPQV